MHRHRQDQAHRLAKIKEPPGPPVVQDLGRVGQVPGHGQHAGGLGQQVPGVGQHLGVVVGIDDPRVRNNRLGGLVSVRGGRQPAADVQELPDALLGGVGDGAGLELPGLDGQLGGVRVDLQNPIGLFPVRLEVVLAAQQEVVNPGDAGHVGAEPGFGYPQLGAQPVHGFGLGEDGLHAGIGGVGDVEQPVTDDALVNAVFGTFELQRFQCGPDRQGAFAHCASSVGLVTVLASRAVSSRSAACRPAIVGWRTTRTTARPCCPAGPPS